MINKSFFKKICFSIFAIIPLFSSAQTYVSGIISASTSWIPASSPYVIQGDVEVPFGVTLTIEPGVTVFFTLSTELRINDGKLIAIGNSSDSIRFIRDTTTSTIFYWDGIILLGTQESKLEYCTIEGASTGIETSLTGNSFMIYKNCSFIDCGAGLVTGVSSNSCLVDSCLFVANTFGMIYYGSAEIRNSLFTLNDIALNGTGTHLLINNKILNSTQTGINMYFNDSVTGNYFSGNHLAIQYSGGKLEGNSIDSNYVGISIFQPMSIIISCNKICNNTSSGINYFDSAPANISNNYWCTNDTAIISAVIYDGNDSPSYGVLSFLPIDNSQCYISVEIDDLFVNKNLELYPNPASNYITVSSAAINKIEVINCLGKVIQEYYPQSNNDKFEFDISELPDGFYIVRQGFICRKFIKQ